MPDLEALRDLGGQVQPPPLEALEDVARRRGRRLAASTVLAAGLAVAVAVALIAFDGAREAGPDPILPSPSPTRVTPSPTPTERPLPPPTRRTPRTPR